MAQPWIFLSSCPLLRFNGWMNFYHLKNPAKIENNSIWVWTDMRIAVSCHLPARVSAEATMEGFCTSAVLKMPRRHRKSSVAGG
ncbi:hypothetical protein Q8A67_020218 [Cirrhinus molitorella]|uniref:Uncharacterized protein n=1 Tax=Cirrhinus molitorella TaxID=172907 RepID=A0AA88P8G6_9TELE|nr:hypothetical protein Q8A67_020218 [Cirrhinus molitorella]